VICKAGPWNDNRPFTYDHDDPLGLNVQNKLLSTYLRTRRGNCVSMPTLFLILADRLGLNVSFGTAPLHVFIRYTDPQGRTFNIETTSGANLARPEWYRQNLPMTDKAIQSGLYMRTLTRRETVAHMASTVMEARLNEGKFQDAIDVGTAILEQFPRDGYTLVKRGHAYGEPLRIECIERFASRNAMPPETRTRCDTLAKRNDEDFGKAEAMGWTPSQ
jgi:regulator of sirC expression with transglutaminase-like and TPR domain